jgi:hypothetical protein
MVKNFRFWAAALMAAVAWGADRNGGDYGSRFQTSDRCIACHNGLATSAGEDVSIGFNWRATMMANSSRDPYWQAGVRRETLDHPSAAKAIEDECSVCHMPMSRYESKLAGREGEVFAHLSFNPEKTDDRLAADGVSCSVCHQITQEKLGTRESFVGRFVIDTTRKSGERQVFGPFEIDAGRTRIMQSSSRFRPTEAKHIQQSEVCATCHTLYTKALGPDGQVIGELPEQMPYLEWLHSDYREQKSCQACHMPEVAEETRISAVLGEPRKGLSRHVFLGGNFFMQNMLNRYRAELKVAALPQELSDAAARTVAHLQLEAANLSITRSVVRGGRLEAEVEVRNLGGHKLPTAYPSRRAWLHFVVRDRNRSIVFESGALTNEGAIRGNDNDADATRFEPHYTTIDNAEQVQIYESIMGDPAGAPTTGLLTADRFLKDNRLLPRGFDKQTASKDVAVVGVAAADGDFTGQGDRVRYSVELGGAQGPYQIESELGFQPISFRWASNLRKYDSEETRRFTRYYDSMSGSSAVVLVRASATTN